MFYFVFILIKVRPFQWQLWRNLPLAPSGPLISIMLYRKRADFNGVNTINTTKLWILFITLYYNCPYGSRSFQLFQLAVIHNLLSKSIWTIWFHCNSCLQFVRCLFAQFAREMGWFSIIAMLRFGLWPLVLSI